jgi:hypothetical protein
MSHANDCCCKTSAVADHVCAVDRIPGSCLGAWWRGAGKK